MVQPRPTPKLDMRNPSLLELLKQLIQEATAWSNAEIALTRLDAKSLVRNYVVAAGFMFFGFAVLIAAIFTLAQSIIGGLAAYVYGHTVAGLVVSLVLFGLTAACFSAALFFITRKKRVKGVIFQRLLNVKLD